MPRKSNDASHEISDFEKQRLANIAERDALLKEITLETQSSGLYSQFLPKGALGSTAKPKKKPAPKKVKEESPAPRRVSSRLRGIAAESEVAKRKADEAFEEAQQYERAKRVRKSDAFGFDDMVISGQKLSGDSLIGVDVVNKGVAKPYERTFSDSDIKETTDKDLKILREEMSGLRMWEAWEPNSMRGCILLVALILKISRNQDYARANLFNDISSLGGQAASFRRRQDGSPGRAGCVARETRARGRRR